MTRPWRALAGALLLFAALAPASPARAQEVKQAGNRPDYSGITSKAAASKLARTGQLVKIHLFPKELGGPNDPHNLLYIPTAVEEVRQHLIGTLRRFTDEDLIDKLDVQADYKGSSIIPSRIRFTATHSRGGPPFEAVLEIW